MADYNFIQVPTNLYLCLDRNCRELLVTLIQLSSKYADKEGWFFRSNDDMEAETYLKHGTTLNGALDALLNRGIIDFIPQQQGKGVKQSSRKYKVNFDTFKEYEDISVEDCIKNPDYKITTSNYDHSFEWQGKEWAGKRASLAIASTKTSLEPQQKSATNIDNKENRDIIEN